MQRRADSRGAVGLAVLALLAGAALPAVAQESEAAKPPTSATTVKPQPAPNLRVRLVRADQLNAPVRTDASPAPLASAVPTGQPDLPPARASQSPDYSASLFDALVSNGWGVSGFDGPPATIAESPAGDEQSMVRDIRIDSSVDAGAAVPTASLPDGFVPPRIPGSLSPAAAADDGAYLLGPGDVIEVFVWRNQELSREVPVRPDGRISLPLVGEVIATGKTPEQLQQEIVAALSQYVQMPTVTVSIKQIRSLVVYVLGNVTKPGPVQMDRSLTVLQAIAMAGGLNDFADRKDIVVLRTDEFGVHQRWNFRYDDVVAGRDLQTNLSLRAGDVIYVP